MGAILISASFVSPIKLEIHADSMVPGEEVIVIANHQLFNDWLVLWMWAYLWRQTSGIKIMLRGDLKKYPILGWGMWIFGFIFLKRRLKHDEEIIKESLRRIPKDPYTPLWLLIFPEGTLGRKALLEKSTVFALKNGYTPMKHVLFPRDAGFRILVEELHHRVDAVYDVTIAYDLDGLPQDALPYDFYPDTSFFSGFSPKRVCLDIRRIPMAEFERNEQALQQWIRNTFVRKNELLSYFRTHRRFPERVCQEIRFGEYPIIQPLHTFLVAIIMYSFYGYPLVYIIAGWFIFCSLFAFIYNTIIRPRN
jgi:1-acyl-sn-glycerol-3-phosphate acyltransferase